MTAEKHQAENEIAVLGEGFKLGCAKFFFRISLFLFFKEAEAGKDVS